MMRLLVAALPAALFAAGAAAQAPAGPWWNPRPAPDDLVVPIGCEVGIAFRKVPIPVGDGPLADRRAIIGDEEAEAAYAEYARDVFLAGAFGQGAEAHGWIGKYEVTRGQYAAVAQGCAALAGLAETERGLPQTGITWAEAVRFAELASAAARRHGAAALPRAGDAHAFFRLPTEAEWEYAARGATAVAETAFRAPLFAMDGPIAGYAHLFRLGAHPQLRPVGLLKPNPLGLHDVLGNAAEMVLDPFRPNRGGRPQGRIGGLIAKGGDVRTPPDRARLALRTEYPPLDADGAPLALPTLGFRLALGLPVLTDLGRGEALREAWEREAAETRARLDEDPVELSRVLERSVTTPEQREAVRRVRQAIVADRFARADAEARAARSAIGAGAVLVRGWRNARDVIAGIDRGIEEANRMPPGPGRDEAIENFARARRSWELNQRTTRRVLDDLTMQQLDTPPAVLREQLAVWKSENASQDSTTLRLMADRFVAYVELARPIRRVDPAAGEDLLGLPLN